MAETAPQLILASQSPRRVELMRTLGVSFTVIASSDVVERIEGDRPYVLAMDNARRKAVAVAQQHPQAVVIGADTIVVRGDRIFGKPQDATDAAGMLEDLEGRPHDVITGVCVVHRDLETEITFFDTTHVWMKPLTAQQITDYVAAYRPLDKAGAYAIQDDYEIVKKIEGSYTNVVGLPMERLRGTLEKLGVLASTDEQP